MALDQRRLQEVMSYDPVTGVFTRKSSGRSVGFWKGHYCKIKVDGKFYYSHRLAWLYVTGSWPEFHIDHIDLDPSNNRFSNLRPASRSQNLRNCRLQKRNAVGLKGVSKHYQRYRAQISVDGKTRTIGTFTDPLKAHAAYLNEATRLSGDFARAS